MKMHKNVTLTELRAGDVVVSRDTWERTITVEREVSDEPLLVLIDRGAIEHIIGCRFNSKPMKRVEQACRDALAAAS